MWIASFVKLSCNAARLKGIEDAGARPFTVFQPCLSFFGHGHCWHKQLHSFDDEVPRSAGLEAELASHAMCPSFAYTSLRKIRALSKSGYK